MKDVNKTIFFAENDAVMTERGYVESLKAEFYMEIQSDTFGFNFNLFIKCSNCECRDKYHNGGSNEANVKMDFQSHFHMALLRM